MIDLTQTQPGDVQAFGRSLFVANRDSLGSLEDAATLSVQAVYDNFRQPNGESLFALFRIFRISHYDELPPSLQEEAHADVPYWLVLAASAGDEPTWNNRWQSQAHLLQPIDANLSPMFIAAFEQMGIQIEGAPIENLDVQQSHWSSHFFHVENVVGNHLIPHQTDFVQPYGIHSALGVGSMFRSGAMGMAIGFSKMPINRELAQNFVEIAPFIFTLLSHYDLRQLWN